MQVRVGAIGAVLAQPRRKRLAVTLLTSVIAVILVNAFIAIGAVIIRAIDNPTRSTEAGQPPLNYLDGKKSAEFLLPFMFP